jgi:hypothetical protein
VSFALKGVSPTAVVNPISVLLVDWEPRNGPEAGLSTECSSRGKHDGDNESVKGESLGEDHHENKGDQDIPLGVSTDTGVTDDTNAKTGGEGGETTAEASSELLVATEVVVIPCCGNVEVFIISNLDN